MKTFYKIVKREAASWNTSKYSSISAVYPLNYSIGETTFAPAGYLLVFKELKDAVSFWEINKSTNNIIVRGVGNDEIDLSNKPRSISIKSLGLQQIKRFWKNEILSEVCVWHPFIFPKGTYGVKSFTPLSVVNI